MPEVIESAALREGHISPRMALLKAWCTGFIITTGGSVDREGPERHGGHDHWLSPEVRSGPEVATILTDVLGQEVRCDIKGPDDFETFLKSSGIPIES